MIKQWNGSAFVDATPKIWNGSSFVDPGSAWIWDGSQFVKVWPPPKVEYVGAASGGGTSIAIPTHQVGDAIVIIAGRNIGSTLPSKPSAGGTVPTWTDLATPQADGSARVVGTIATATNTTSGTFTGAGAMGVIVLRGANPSSPVGGVGGLAGTNVAAPNAPAITLSQADGSSMVIQLYYVYGMTSWSAVPSGYTRRTSFAAGGLDQQGICINTKDDTTSDGSIVQPFGPALSARYAAAQVEIKV